MHEMTRITDGNHAIAYTVPRQGPVLNHSAPRSLPDMGVEAAANPCNVL